MKGQTALVTGGGRGIGEAVARRLAAAGANIVVVSRTPAELERVAAETGGRCFTCDVTSPEQVEEVARRIGPVEILVNNAGIADSAPLARMDLAFWRRVIDTNLTSAFLFCRALVPGMLARKYGRVVNVASAAGKRGAPYLTAYAASKHGLLGFNSSLAMELADTGVLVNAVCPGYVDTPMTRRNLERISRITGKTGEEILHALLASSGQTRPLTAAAVADVVLALARPECSHTGAAIDLA